MMPRLLATLLLAAGTNAYAQPISYSEFVSGDLTVDRTFALDVGVNTFVGSLRVGNDPDLDPFRFSVPVGTQLTSFSLAYSIVSSGTQFSVWGVAYAIDSISNAPQTVAPYEICALYDTLGGQVFRCSDSPISFFASSLPLGPDLYEIRTGQMFTDGSAAGGSVSYSLQLTVSPVPESAAVVLFPLGVALVLSATRTRTQRRSRDEA